MNQNFNYLKGANASGTQFTGYPENLEALSGLLLLGNGTGTTTINSRINLQHEARDLSKFNNHHYKKLVLMANTNSPSHLNLGTHLSINPVTRTYNIDFNETRTSSPINNSKNLSKLHEVFQSITEDHKYTATPSFVQRNNAAACIIRNKPNHSPADSGYSPTFLEDQLNFPAPILASSLSNHMTPQEYMLPFETLAEYEKIERESHHLKQTFIETKLAECPVDYGYNESKSRLRRTYEDPMMEEGRAKNNLASRRSRYKKKLSSRLLSINYDYDLIENRNLFEQEQWLLGVIHELEQQIFDEGVDINTLKAIRNKCGLK